MSQAKLIVIRHGETDWNVEGRLQGSADIPLNETGRSQAAKLADQFRDHKIHAIYASPLIRAQETAQFFHDIHGCDFHHAHELREGSMGSLEGMTFVDYHKTYHTELDHLSFKAVPDMESAEDVAIRAMPRLYQIADSHKGETVVIVSHGGVIRVIYSELMKVPHRRVMIKNTGFIEVHGTGLELTVINSQGVEIRA
jgi:broad specificity phosphatase PhoE